MDGTLGAATITIGVGLAPAIALIINPLKRFIPADLMLYVAIAAGLAWTIALHWTQGELARETIMATIFLGVSTGIAATGAFDALKTVTTRNETAAKIATALTVLPKGDDDVRRPD